MKVLITGCNGFVGKNLTEFLKTKNDIELYLYDINSTIDDLKKYCKNCDVVVNLAGINRTIDKDQFVKGNLGVITQVVDFLQENNNKAPIIYSSSIQAQLDNDYGKSKKLAEDFLFDYANRTGNRIYIYRFTNLFGKWCKPNYNSVIATFCNNIANDMPIIVNDKSTELTLCYIDDVIYEIYNAILGRANLLENGFCGVPTQYVRSLGNIATLVTRFKEDRNSLSVINTADEFEKKLYSTYLSYLPINSFAYNIKSHKDNRGLFAEILRTKEAGQFSVNKANPGITKGNHWHNTKNEKFLVVQGNAEIKFRKPFDSEIITYNVDGDNLQVVDIPCGYTHNITNIGQNELIFFIWCNECYDEKNPDTYFLEV